MKKNNILLSILLFFATTLAYAGDPSFQLAPTYQNQSAAVVFQGCGFLPWSNILNTPTTLEGYGITDISFVFPASKTIVGTNSRGQIVDASSASLSNNTSGTASNITAYTVNQNVGSSNSPTFEGLTLSNIAIGTQCVQANSSGVLSGTGGACGSGTGGGFNMIQNQVFN